MVTPRKTQLLRDAEAKAATGEYDEAIRSYESALDGTPRSAEVHYKLAVMYDDKMKDPLNALHHFKRYLALQPNGAHASDVKALVKKDEITLLTSLSGDSVVPRTEAARLINDNLDLRKQLDERGAKAKGSADDPGSARKSDKPVTKAGNKSYVVETGDTLYSISQKFYKSPSHWKQIRSANRDQLGDGRNLKPGQTLLIP